MVRTDGLHFDLSPLEPEPELEPMRLETDAMSEQVLNSDHLLPCPFCGARPVRRINNDILFIECRECVSIGFHNHVRLGCQADQEWNRRTEIATNDWLERRESVKAGVNVEDGRIAEPKEIQ